MNKFKSIMGIAAVGLVSSSLIVLSLANNSSSQKSASVLPEIVEYTGVNVSVSDDKISLYFSANVLADQVCATIGYYSDFLVSIKHAGHVNADHLKCMGGLKNIREIVFLPESVFGRADNVVLIGNAKSLKSLTLPDGDVSAKFLESSVGLPSLENLIARNALTEEGLLSISGRFPNLRTLSVSGALIQSGGFGGLASIDALEELALSDTSFSDADVKYVSELSKLKYLAINNTPITRDGLKSLFQIRSLTHLSISGITVDQGDMDKLLAKRPDIKIFGKM